MVEIIVTYFFNAMLMLKYTKMCIRDRSIHFTQPLRRQNSILPPPIIHNQSLHCPPIQVTQPLRRQNSNIFTTNTYVLIIHDQQ